MFDNASGFQSNNSNYNVTWYNKGSPDLHNNER